MVLRGGDQRNRHALVAAEASAADRVHFDLRRARGPPAPPPTGKLGPRPLRPFRAEHAGIGIPPGLPAGDVTGVIAGEPTAEADADQPLRPGLARRRYQHPSYLV